MSFSSTLSLAIAPLIMSSASLSPLSSSILSPPSLSSTISSSTANQQAGQSSAAVQQQQQQASWCYMSKLITGLIEMFENNLTEEGNCTQAFCSEIICVRAYEVLVNYLENYYSSPIYQQQIQIDQQQPPQSPQMHQIHIKLQSYHSNIRRDLFEFLIRIRSDRYKRFILLSRTNRRKYIKSKYLVLNIFPEETKLANKEWASENNQLDYSRILKLFELCLDRVRIYFIQSNLL
jgi:peptide subunit release factor RF-3